MRKRGMVLGLTVIACAAVWFALSSRAQFLVGGALVNLGYRMQDHLHSFDLGTSHTITPEQILSELEQQNALSASVREQFPRSIEHPVVALLVCIDARIDTSELVGDTRHYYYIVRTAGSVLGTEEQEMLELAVRNGVKLVVLTTHTDCAAEKVAADPAKAKDFPAITALLAERERHIADFMARPLIKERVAAGTLRVEHMLIDTATDRLLRPVPSRRPIPVASE